MAYLKLGYIGEASGHNMATGLKRCIEYIFNPEKTNGNEYIGGYNLYVTRENCVSDAYSQMISTKKFFRKEWGRQGYHFKLSFPKGDDISPELALKITNEFCYRCFPDYECAYSVHTNTEHLHSHVVFNSIDMVEGRKYRYEKGDWVKQLQPVINNICKKYGLAELCLDMEERKEMKTPDAGKPKKTSYKYSKQSSNNGKYTRDKIAIDVEECIAKASSYEEFVSLMKGKGHLYKDTGKYISVTAPGMERATRLYKLTPDGRYTKDNITKMISGIYMSDADVKKKLFAEFNAYESRVKDTFAYKYDIKYARLLEEETLIRVKGLNNKKALDIYKSYLGACDKQLNIMRKNIYKILDRHSEAYAKLDEMISIYKYYKEYEKTGDEKYKAQHDRCLMLYGELTSKGYDIYEMHMYRKKATTFIKQINDFKKHVYVQRKIAGRIDDRNILQKDSKKENKYQNKRR